MIESLKTAVNFKADTKTSLYHLMQSLHADPISHLAWTAQTTLLMSEAFTIFSELFNRQLSQRDIQRLTKVVLNYSINSILDRVEQKPMIGLQYLIEEEFKAITPFRTSFSLKKSWKDIWINFIHSRINTAK